MTHILLVFMLFLVPGLNTENSQDTPSASFALRFPKYNRRGHGTVQCSLCSNDDEGHDFLVLKVRSNDLRDLPVICLD